MLTLLDFKTEVPSMIKNRGCSSLIAGWLQGFIDWVITQDNFWWARSNDTFATVSGTAEYYLTSRVSGKQIYRMVDETNEKKLDEITEEELYQDDETPTDTGLPEKYAIMGLEEVQAQPTSASVVKVVSSSISDVGKKVIARGIASSVDNYDEITLADVGGVATGTGTVSFSTVHSVAKRAVWTGKCTATTNSDAVTIAVIPPEDLIIQCPRIRVQYVPGGAYTIRYFYYKQFRKLTQDGEVSEFPVQFHRTLLLPGVCWWGRLNSGDLSKAGYFKSLVDEQMVKLINWSRRAPNRTPKKSAPGVKPFYRIPRDAPNIT